MAMMRWIFAFLFLGLMAGSITSIVIALDSGTNAEDERTWFIIGTSLGISAELLGLVYVLLFSGSKDNGGTNEEAKIASKEGYSFVDSTQKLEDLT